MITFRAAKRAIRSKETKVIFPLAPESAMMTMMMRGERRTREDSEEERERKIKGKCCQLH